MLEQAVNVIEEAEHEESAFLEQMNEDFSCFCRSPCMKYSQGVAAVSV